MYTTYRRLFDLLTPHEKRRFVLVMLLVVAMSAFELAGVAIILPFLTVVSDPSQIDSNTALAWLNGLWGDVDHQTFTIRLGVLVLAVILIGSAVKIVTMYAIARYGMMRGYHISSRLLEVYLRQPYAWFLNQNGASLSRTILGEVQGLVNNVLVPALRLISQVASLLLIVGFLLYIQPVAAISVAAIVGAFYGGIYLAVSGVLKRIGQELLRVNQQRFQTVGEAMQGIKEIKLSGLETLYSTRYRDPARHQAEAMLLSNFLSEFPRFALEAVAFGGIVLMVLLFVISGDGTIEDIIPTVGIFTLAGLRILAATQQVFRGIAQIRTGQAALELVHSELTKLNTAPPLPPAERPEPLGLSRALELRGVSFKYPKADRTAIENLDLTIPARSKVGIVGGTGAGKTTVIDLILGLLEPRSGAILVDGKPLGPESMAAWQNTLGYVPQEIYLSNDTIAANIAFGIPTERIDRSAVIRAAKLAELHAFVTEQLADGYDQRVGDRGVRLSGGQRQRIGIARALYHDPDVLILDEATSALDNITEQVVMEAVNNLGGAKTIVMIAHRLTTVQNCDRILLMDQGRIIDAGTYAELLSHNDTFRRMARQAS